MCVSKSHLMCEFCRRVKGCMYVCVVVTHSGNLLCEFCRKVMGRCVVAPIPATCCASFVGVSRGVCVCAF